MKLTNLNAPIEVCFVCLGNICRSPTAEGVMRHLVQERGLAEYIAVDSAGTAAYHVGEPPDRRSVKTARARGILVGGRARQFVAVDFNRFHYVLAMDRDNHENLLRLRPKHSLGRLELLLAFDSASPRGASVPDPYYGGPEGFDHVVDLCLRGCNGLLDEIVAQHLK